MEIAIKGNGIMISHMDRGFMREFLPKGSIQVHGSRVCFKEKGKPRMRMDHNTMDNFTRIFVMAKEL